MRCVSKKHSQYPLSTLYNTDDYQTIISNIRELLNKIQLSMVKNHRIDLCIDLFDYLIQNKLFLHSYIRFSVVVYNKLIELNQNNDWTLSDYYLNKLFHPFILNK